MTFLPASWPVLPVDRIIPWKTYWSNQPQAPPLSIALVSRELAHKSINMSRLSVVPGNRSKVGCYPIATFGKAYFKRKKYIYIYYKQTSLDIRSVKEKPWIIFPSSYRFTAILTWEVMIPKTDWSQSHVLQRSPVVSLCDASLRRFRDSLLGQANVDAFIRTGMQQVFECIGARDIIWKSEKRTSQKKKTLQLTSYMRDDEVYID